jgi:2-polyprenyl-3-methyl-5-hydroxy-6-metoxy-1,4-benzoquinol methylase
LREFNRRDMPGSRPILIPPICNMMMNLLPSSVLDVGMGLGKYGVLAREYVDLWGKAAGKAGKCQVEGIEIVDEYITDWARNAYDEIHIGDAMSIVPNMNRRFDLVLCVEVIEHLEKAQGIDLVKAMVKRCSDRGNLVITTPADFRKQGAVLGNESEIHKCLWTHTDFDVSPLIKPSEKHLLKEESGSYHLVIYDRRKCG